MSAPVEATPVALGLIAESRGARALDLVVSLRRNLVPITPDCLDLSR